MTDETDDEAFKQKFRERLADFTSQENVEASLKLGEHIAANARPDDSLGARLTLVIAPFLEGDEELGDLQYLCAFAINAWNMTLMPAADEARFLDLFLRTTMINGDPDDYFRGLTTSLCAVKRELFPDDMRFIADCDVRQQGKTFTIIASAGPSYMNGPRRRGR